jgi:hypothetical protein
MDIMRKTQSVEKRQWLDRYCIDPQTKVQS